MHFTHDYRAASLFPMITDVSTTPPGICVTAVYGRHRRIVTTATPIGAPSAEGDNDGTWEGSNRTAYNLIRPMLEQSPEVQSKIAKHFSRTHFLRYWNEVSTRFRTDRGNATLFAGYAPAPELTRTPELNERELRDNTGMVAHMLAPAYAALARYWGLTVAEACTDAGMRQLCPRYNAVKCPHGNSCTASLCLFAHRTCRRSFSGTLADIVVDLFARLEAAKKKKSAHA